jgi:hypothetical protein
MTKRGLPHPTLADQPQVEFPQDPAIAAALVLEDGESASPRTTNICGRLSAFIILMLFNLDNLRILT